MSLLNFARTFLNGKRRSDDLVGMERDCTLRVFMNDTRCELIVQDRNGQKVGQLERLVSDNVLESKSLLLAATEALPLELEHRIGNVEIFLDDQEISVVDSRQAKLTHFEGRTLAEFGKYQLGGKPVCFASHRFGETSAQETEKRIVAYISEDRLTTVLFALGKLARFTTFFGPWSLQKLLGDQSEESQAQLAIHGHYSTLSLTNNSAGAVAVRHLPMGTADLTAAYAAMHGIDDKEAGTALALRPRLTIGKEWPAPANAPSNFVGTHMALVPILERLSGEVTATADYFEFQRLAGRAPDLQLSVLGSRIAGFSDWLSDMLHIGVSDAGSEPQAAAAPALNLLEGMRTGLLKMGNQHYDFIGGRFVPSASSPAGSASAAAKWKSASSQQVALNDLKPFAAPIAAAAIFMLAVGGAYAFVLAPMDQESQTSLNLYSGMLSRMDQAKPHSVPVGEPVLWARDLMSVGAAMPYDMKLKRIALVSGAGSVGTTLEVSGTLPREGKDNLQLIGRFMTRVSASPALRRRLTEVTFAGAGQADSKDSEDTVFKIVGKVAVGPKP
jgi:hypothetical protein